MYKLLKKLKTKNKKKIDVNHYCGGLDNLLTYIHLEKQTDTFIPLKSELPSRKNF